MEQYGNTASYNVESVLHKNVVGSEYYNKTCIKLEDWGQVVDEIWETVSDVEPWMSGNARGASTAFCLLFRSVRTARFHCLLPLSVYPLLSFHQVLEPCKQTECACNSHRLHLFRSSEAS